MNEKEIKNTHIALQDSIDNLFKTIERFVYILDRFDGVNTSLLTEKMDTSKQKNLQNNALIPIFKEAPGKMVAATESINNLLNRLEKQFE